LLLFASSKVLTFFLLLTFFFPIQFSNIWRFLSHSNFYLTLDCYLFSTCFPRFLSLQVKLLDKTILKLFIKNLLKSLLRKALTLSLLFISVNFFFLTFSGFLKLAKTEKLLWSKRFYKNFSASSKAKCLF
jgi:hypothetical protein